MTVGEWVLLDKQFSRALVQDLPRILRRDVRSLMRDAGLEYQELQGRVSLRVLSDKDPFVFIKPLQRKNGDVRNDARQILATGEELDLMDVRDARGRDLQTLQEIGDLAITRAQGLQYELLINDDPISALRENAKQGTRLYRVGSYNRFFIRTRVLEVLEELAAGMSPEDLKWGPNRVTSMLVSGRWQILPASLVCFPMTALFQPLAMVVTTRSAAEIAVLPPKGSTFERSLEWSSWPVGYVGASLFGQGVGLNSSRAHPRHADASALLRRCMRGANEMLQWFLDPVRWQTANGEFDPSERWIAWTSVLQAFEALISIAERWTYSSSVWDAFRALGILNGIWQGRNRKPESLKELLRPDNLRLHAVAHIPDVTLRDWSLGIVDRWEAEIHRGFPADDIEKALMRVEDLRHLIHGVGAPLSRRTDRLETLRLVAEHQPSFQLIPNLAVMWWSAALFAPSKICRPGLTPWSTTESGREAADRSGTLSAHRHNRH
jgi:hypothetical protein